MPDNRTNRASKAVGSLQPESPREKATGKQIDSAECHISKLANELVAQILSYLPITDQLRASEAYGRFADAFVTPAFQQQRYHWDRPGAANGKHTLFSVDKSYFRCMARSGVLESCVFREGSYDYFVCPTRTADPLLCMDEQVWAPLTLERLTAEAGYEEATTITLHNKLKRFRLCEVVIWIFNESCVKTYGDERNVVELGELNLYARDAECTIRQLFEAVVRKVEYYLDREGLRWRACYGKRFEFRVMGWRQGHGMFVCVHPVLDEIWPFPDKNTPGDDHRPPEIIRNAYPDMPATFYHRYRRTPSPLPRLRRLSDSDSDW